MVNVGQAIGYLTLDTSGFKSGFQSAMSDLKTLGDKSTTTSDKFTAMGSAFTKVGGTLTKNVTLPLVGIGTAAVAVSGKFESAMSQVQATMGITKDSMTTVHGETVNAMDALGAIAKKMGAETAFSATECAEALNYMALAGYDVGTSIDMLPNVLSLAAAGGMELAKASDMITDSQTALGLTLDQTNILVDQMAKTASKSNTSVSQLGDAILSVGGTAKSLSGGTTELNTVLGLLADNGIKASESGTHLRNIMLAMNPTTKDACEAWATLGVSAYDADGNLRPLQDTFSDLNAAMDGFTDEERSKMITKMFHMTDLASVNALLSTSADRWNELSGAIDDSSGAASQMADTQLDNLQGQLTILKSALEGAAISFGNLLLPLIKDAVSFIQNIVDCINNLSDKQKETIVRIAEVVAVVGPALLIIGKVLTLVGSITRAIQVLQPVMMALNAVMAANPVGIVVVAIAGLVAAFIALWNNCEGFRNFWIGLWDNIKEVFNAVVDWLRQAVQDVITFFQELPAKIGEAIDAVINWFKELPEKIAYWLGFAAGKVIDWVSNVWTTVKEGIPKLITNIGTWFSELPGKIWKWLVQVVNKVIAWRNDMIQKAKTMVSDFVAKIVGGIKSLPDKFRTWFGKVKTYLKNFSLLQIGKDIFNSLWNGLKSIWDKMFGWIGGVVNKIKSIFSSAKSGYADATASAEGSYASGLDYVPKDMLVKVHQGEAILTKQENMNRANTPATFGVVNINISGAQYSDEQSLARAVAYELQSMTDRRSSVWA